MKHLFLLLFAVIAMVSVKAQTGTATVDVTQKIGVKGGDGTGKIVSVLWTTLLAPVGATVVYSAATSPKTDITVSEVGHYKFQIQVKDNLGNIATGIVEGDAYFPQTINIDLTGTKLVFQIK